MKPPSTSSFFHFIFFLVHLPILPPAGSSSLRSRTLNFMLVTDSHLWQSVFTLVNQLPSSRQEKVLAVMLNPMRPPLYRDYPHISPGFRLVWSGWIFAILNAKISHQFNFRCNAPKSRMSLIFSHFKLIHLNSSPCYSRSRITVQSFLEIDIGRQWKYPIETLIFDRYKWRFASFNLNLLFSLICVYDLETGDQLNQKRDKELTESHQ